MPEKDFLKTVSKNMLLCLEDSVFWNERKLTDSTSKGNEIQRPTELTEDSRLKIQ